jgi:hypothetical protein
MREGGAVASEGTPVRSRRTVLIAAVVVAALLVAVIGWLVTQDEGNDGTRPGAQETRPTATDASSTPEGDEGSECQGLAGETDELPEGPPDDLSYEVENRAVIPVSDTYGPADRSGAVWTCFSHSPMGAVMAAETISTRRIASRDRVQVGEEQLVDNEGREVYLRAVRATDPDDLTAEPGTFAQPAGFRVESYTGESAVVALVWRHKDGVLRAGILTVVWEDDTWRLQLLPDGSDTAALTPVASLDDYIAWGL